MEQPTTARKSFEEETEFSLEMIQRSQSDIRDALRAMKSDIGFIYSAAILILISVFALFVAMIYS